MVSKLKFISYPLRAYQYVLYIHWRAMGNWGLSTLNALCILYLLELVAPLAYFYKSGIPLYFGFVVACILGIYNDYVYNSEIINEIEDLFEKLKMPYLLIVCQFLFLLFLPFVVLILSIKT